jgi:hypothetical protein
MRYSWYAATTLYSLTLPRKLMGGTSFSLSSASDHHHKTLFFFCVCVCWPEFVNCTSKAKNKAKYGPKEIKDKLGFWNITTNKRLSQQLAKEKRANYGLKWAWAFEHLPQTRNWNNNRPKRKEPTNSLNGLEPLNIYLKLEIGPPMGQRK